MLHQSMDITCFQMVPKTLTDHANNCGMHIRDAKTFSMLVPNWACYCGKLLLSNVIQVQDKRNEQVLFGSWLQIRLIYNELNHNMGLKFHD